MSHPKIMYSPVNHTDGRGQRAEILFPVVENVTNSVNGSNRSGGACGSVNDIELDKTYRLLMLYLTITCGIVGSILVLLWMVCNRRISPRFNHLSRVNAFILNLTMADILVILLAVFPQLIWEYVDREWSAGPVMCKLVKFLQSFSMMSSNYILVVIAVDRHQAIRAPLKESMPVWKMAGIGWLMAAICSIPMMGVFHLVTDADGYQRCENIFRNKPKSHRQAWMTYIYLVVFFVPLFVLVVCYTRIFLKIAQKASEHNNKKSLRFKTGKVHLQSTHSTSLPRAKIKTLKLTFVIIMVFIVCSLPYFIVEMIMSYGDHCIISRELWAILGGMAACNSAANPFVFLAFNVNVSWIKEMRQKLLAPNRKPRYMYSANSSMDSHYSIKHYGNTTLMTTPS